VIADARFARAQDLEINEVADGFVVYQPSRDRVHYLNHTAALVLELCTGSNTAFDIERAVRAAYDLPDSPSADVNRCLERFVDEGLVT
jgi:hypothetical protein